MTTLYSALHRNSHFLRSILEGVFVYLQPLRASFYLFTTCGCTVVMVILTYNVKEESNRNVVNSKQSANQSQNSFSLGSNFCLDDRLPSLPPLSEGLDPLLYINLDRNTRKSTQFTVMFCFTVVFLFFLFRLTVSTMCVNMVFDSSG